MNALEYLDYFFVECNTLLIHSHLHSCFFPTASITVEGILSYSVSVHAHWRYGKILKETLPNTGYDRYLMVAIGWFLPFCFLKTCLFFEAWKFTNVFLITSNSNRTFPSSRPWINPFSLPLSNEPLFCLINISRGLFVQACYSGHE